MTAAADPQERQKLFDTVVRELGLGLRKDPTAVSLSRANDTNGTFGLLLQSPEPISLTRDVTITLTHHVRVWVPGWIPPVHVPPVVVGPVKIPPIGIKLPPITVTPQPHGPVPGPGPVEAVAAAAMATLKSPLLGGAIAAGTAMGKTIAGGTSAGGGTQAQAVPSQVQTSEALQQALPAIRFDGKQAVLAANLAAFGAGDRIARVVAGPNGNVVEIYDAPAVTVRNADARGVLRETVPLAQAALRADLSSIAALAAGTIAVLPKGGGIPPWWGHWEEHDVAVPLTTLSNRRRDRAAAALARRRGAKRRQLHPARGARSRPLASQRRRRPRAALPRRANHHAPLVIVESAQREGTSARRSRTPAAISYERRRAAWSKICDVIISSSAPVRSMNACNASRTVSGEPIAEQDSTSSSSARSRGPTRSR